VADELNLDVDPLTRWPASSSSRPMPIGPAVELSAAQQVTLSRCDHQLLHRPRRPLKFELDLEMRVRLDWVTAPLTPRRAAASTALRTRS
jgi:hypothetical protein